MAGNIAKKGSGQFNLSRDIGGEPNPSGTTGVKPGAGGSGASGEGGTPSLTQKGSGQFTVDRSVVKPPTRGPAK